MISYRFPGSEVCVLKFSTWEGRRALLLGVPKMIISDAVFTDKSKSVNFKDIAEH